MPKSIHEALQKAKEETLMAVEKGRGVYDRVMSILDKRRKPVTDYIDKITEQDKEAYKKKKPSPSD
jgi:F0F1-type ATP synthase membrane subunit b/b'